MGEGCNLSAVSSFPRQMNKRRGLLFCFFSCVFPSLTPSCVCLFAGDDGRLYEGQGEGLVPQKGQRTGGFVPLGVPGGVFFHPGAPSVQASSRAAATAARTDIRRRRRGRVARLPSHGMSDKVYFGSSDTRSKTLQTETWKPVFAYCVSVTCGRRNSRTH